VRILKDTKKSGGSLKPVYESSLQQSGFYEGSPAFWKAANLQKKGGLSQDLYDE
jgi:hypothetical protein